ncbi:mechanosensitive ion channel [Jiangella aurantiaca]|uniref:Mechanosensitive ion channel n=1 Tax=Jiangella aurantiaca TaxID=2530373 RepID=A0A4V2YR64_9ACTN|nr:mechanosensitive ion channel domain-containing protein [Jiangella aurantiaca]TDD64937.1 mechanosensitive ion channel [Jiangella aurantiaca]
MTEFAAAVGVMDQVEDYVARADVSGWDALFAVVTLAGAWLLSKVTRRLLSRLLGRVAGIPDDAKRLLSRMGGYVVIVLGLAYALSLLGADVAPLLTVVLVVVVVVALALRSVAENFAAGIVLQTRRTVRFGDEIAALGHTGVVAAMNGRSVVIRTADGRQVHLPNVKLLEAPVANHTILGARRSELVAHITGEVDVDIVERVRTAVAGADAVLAEPAPGVSTVEIGLDRLSLTIGFWHDPPDGATASSAVATDVAKALRALHLGFALGPPTPHGFIPIG